MKVGDVIVLPVRQGNPPHDGTIFDAGDYAICGGVGYKQDSVAIVHAINTHDAHVDLIRRMSEMLGELQKEKTSGGCPVCSVFRSHDAWCPLAAIIAEAKAVE